MTKPVETDVRTEQRGASTANTLAVQDVLQLALLPGIGPRHFARLSEHFGSAAAVLSASSDQLQAVEGIGAALSQTILSASTHNYGQTAMEHCRRSGLEVLLESQPEYPRPLRRIHDAPPVLFASGRIEPVDELAIAIVGTRHATAYGRMQATKIASGLARCGITIISGLARGIDGAAHQGALDANGRTIAVLGSGHDEMYPAEHTKLAQEVAKAGCVLSEFPPWTKPRGPYFPQRNRLISGLSLGVLVIEAADRSGSLVTARHAMEQGREVFALPGPVSSRVSRGCHALIRDGAKLVENAEQIIDELGPLAESVRPSPEQDTVVRHPLELTLNEQELTILGLIGTEPTSIDAIISRAELPVQRVLSTLSVLEMRRLIRRLSGQFVIRL